MLTAPDSYAPVPDGVTVELKPKVRLMGVYSSIDHTSETQFNGWKSILDDTFEAFNKSPLAAELDLTLDQYVFFRKLVAMQTDHAMDQKKLVRLMKAWKALLNNRFLGARHLASLPIEELSRVFSEMKDKAISDLGGLDAWNALSEEQQEGEYEAMMRRLAESYGEIAHDLLSPEEKRDFDYFIWAGCTMHKGLNAVKGGAAAMERYWKDKGITGPKLLANKDNAATLEDASSDLAELSHAERRALEVSGSGGVKLTGLAGALFNHKDDKKGFHDSYKNFFLKELGCWKTFPDTSNTRYHSNCDGAAELFVNQETYLRFLEHSRDLKEKRNFNHMEKNVYEGLQDIPTLTELAVLALYAECVLYGYARQVRGPGTEQLNVLTLGPLHKDLLVHHDKLIDNPDLALATDADFRTASFDKLEWERPEVIASIHKRAPEFPHLRGQFITFLKNAKVTWVRFCEEFEEDGLIANSTPPS